MCKRGDAVSLHKYLRPPSNVHGDVSNDAAVNSTAAFVTTTALRYEPMHTKASLQSGNRAIRVALGLPVVTR